jgi:ADP-ribosylglycohydrolase
VRDRILGCISGGAIGDAFGRPYETLRPPIVISEADEWRLSRFCRTPKFAIALPP